MQNKYIQGLMLASMIATGSLQAGMIRDAVSSLWKTSQTDDATVGVLIAHDVPSVVLEVTGKYKIYDPHTQTFISTRFIGKRRVVQAISDGIKWGEEFPTVHQIQIVPDDTKTSVLVDGTEYKGIITVYDIGSTISIVNDIPIDDYVKSVLNASFSSSLPEELAAAYVIAERTHAWDQIQKSPSRYFTFDRENISYDGLAGIVKKEDFNSAIQSTKNMIMIKENAPVVVNASGSRKESSNKPSLGKLSYDQAEELAKNGSHAAQILSKAFPGSSIVFMNADKG